MVNNIIELFRGIVRPVITMGMVGTTAGLLVAERPVPEAEQWVV